ncbi:hypothetical protein AK812_SmicGene14827 [Symbiodinium microadriaticum]|uniref:Uncharacterized protein n=1 Tax=Symbiodinium microadriaticum TaxID=2951 RepID=A0A1Q9E4H9_SYMMI|nr:hypothetical protein AK812_SmicGene14827 [Symbiodinium microadriaticum]
MALATSIRVNTRMLHPLWSILDDMASLRSLEAVRMTNFQPASDMLKDLQRDGKRQGWMRRLIRYSMRLPFCREKSESNDDVKELADLRCSLTTMRAALRSWAKYVPPYLLKSLTGEKMAQRMGLDKSLIRTSALYDRELPL